MTNGRRIKTKDKDDKYKEQIQFYHRMVTCKIVGGTFAPILDMEQQYPVCPVSWNLYLLPLYLPKFYQPCGIAAV
ncbi:MAG: hypothetical protein AUJ85_07050 [Elusimicrobia bacterium CG1_02_37_114]|nr:MAG: hypothetical protein AUJ85_07050 [Elusimicrobia bacterium CG1_02_37_114]PIV52302.1 MAG: hypothetical protein COS17_09845 [Elusimicrobia bacterium CG02_land_8_20_14_3_00_37_13]PIZ13842.1 MAG: hypothetical protein COY53_02745 [Elusimicrobia bacterium CG_4_10_14_0_8_um_filter_37_32]